MSANLDWTEERLNSHYGDELSVFNNKMRLKKKNWTLLYVIHCVLFSTEKKFRLTEEAESKKGKCAPLFPF